MSNPVETTQADAVVVGGGVGGLQAAHELAKAGLKPLLLEARGTCGGLVFGAPIGGVWVDLGAESYAKRSVRTAELCAELGLEVVDPSGDGSFIWSHQRPAPDAEPGYAFRIPKGVLGIPVDLDDPILPTILTPDELTRAREDLTMGPEVGADCADLASLVEARLGAAVLNKLVDPVAGGVHSAHPSRLSVDVVSPGLRAAMVREGSLVRGAAAQRAAAPAGAVVSAPTGGMFTLPKALTERIASLGGTVAGRRLVTAIERSGDGWAVTHYEAGRAPDPADPPIPVGEPSVVQTQRLIVALDGRAALDLLRPIPELGIDDWTLPRGADLAQVCIVLEASELDGGPRGSGLLVTPESFNEERRVRCKALTHYSIKWPRVVEGSGKHVLRVSYGRAGVQTIEPTLTDALADASTLLGVPLNEDQVVGHAVVHFPNSLPPQTPEHRERVAALTARLEEEPALAVTGAWFAGTGLAAVVSHASDVAVEMSKR